MNPIAFKPVIFVAVVMSWQPIGKWWLVDGVTETECQNKEKELRSRIGSEKELCKKKYVWQYEEMKKYKVQWSHAK